MLRQAEQREREFAQVELVDADETCRRSPLLARAAIHAGCSSPMAARFPRGA